MKKIFTFLVPILMVCLLGCSSDDDSSGDGELLFEVFDVPITYVRYDVPQTNPDFSGVTVYAWAIFDQEQDATNYKLTYNCITSPNLSFEISWQNGQPIPDPGAPVPGVVPGYQMGLIGGQYYIVILGNGCQGAAGGPCTVDGETGIALENGLRSIEGDVTVEITFDGE